MLQSFLICMGMFTKLKLPIVDWSPGKGPSALCFMPAVGLCCALPVVTAVYVCRALGLPMLVGGAIVLLCTFPVCGFVHFDGYMDTSDSLLSSREREEKLRILKDSTVGAFAVISVALLLLVEFAAFSALVSGIVSPLSLLMVPVLSRTLGSMVLFTAKPLSNKGILAYFHDGEKPVHKIITIIELAVILVGFYFLGGSFRVLLAPLAGILAVAALSAGAHKSLGGVNGDIVGAGIVICEAVCYLLLPAVC